MTTVGSEPWKFIEAARETLSPYGKDYAIGAVRGLAVRNMVSVLLPDQTEGFYPIVKIHEMALKELEDVLYNLTMLDEAENTREILIQRLVEGKVWE